MDFGRGSRLDKVSAMNRKYTGYIPRSLPPTQPEVRKTSTENFLPKQSALPSQTIKAWLLWRLCLETSRFAKLLSASTCRLLSTELSVRGLSLLCMKQVPRNKIYDSRVPGNKTNQREAIVLRRNGASAPFHPLPLLSFVQADYVVHLQVVCNLL